SQRIEHRLVATHHRPRGRVELEAQLVVQQQRRITFEHVAHPSSASISPAICSGVVVGAKRLTLPLASTRNLVKFHFTPLLPSRPGARRLSSVNSGCASEPLTSILLSKGKLTP